jgi:hypothetical protein
LDLPSGPGDLCPRVSVMTSRHGIPRRSRGAPGAARRPALGSDAPAARECSARYGG